MDATFVKPTFYSMFGMWDTDVPEILTKIQTINTNNKFNVNIINASNVKILFDMETEMKWIYDNVPRRVCRADIARLYMMRDAEGFYVDMDVLLNPNMHALLEAFRTKSLFLFCEHDNCNPAHMGAREDKKHTRRIFNCIFGSTNKHKNRYFWDACIQLCKTRVTLLFAMGDKYEWTDSDVIWATGPDVITTVYHELKHTLNDICVISRKDSVHYFNHCGTGTWRENNDT